MATLVVVVVTGAATGTSTALDTLTTLGVVTGTDAVWYTLWTAAGTVLTCTILPPTFTGTGVPGGYDTILPAVTGFIATPPPGTMLAVGIGEVKIGVLVVVIIFIYLIIFLFFIINYWIMIFFSI